MENCDLKSELAYFYGTESWHRVSHTGVLASDGILHLSEKAGAFWLVDAIGSYLPDIIRTGDRMATCKLQKRDNGDWVLSLDTLYKSFKQVIEYSDFPIKQITLFLCDNGFAWCLMLPSEY